MRTPTASRPTALRPISGRNLQSTLNYLHRQAVRHGVPRQVELTLCWLRQEFLARRDLVGLAHRDTAFMLAVIELRQDLLDEVAEVKLDRVLERFAIVQASAFTISPLAWRRR